MGITIVRKCLSPKLSSKKALILAGGAVTGGSFMSGGLKALNDYFTNFSVNDFDVFVGMSSGSMIAAPLAGGIPPETILKSLDGTSRRFSPLTSWHYYKPNLSEFVARPVGFFLKAASLISRRLISFAEHYPDWSHGLFKAILNFLLSPSVKSYEDMMSFISEKLELADFPSLISMLPSGIFDNSAIESYIRKNIERNGLTNDFNEAEKISGKKLYITAMRLDRAKRVVFGPDEDASFMISEAIWASTALPGFYKPARIKGVDYVDGGVQQTASIDIAVEKGAKLIVCYNPFRPYEPDEFVEGFSARGDKNIASNGILTVLNQIFRAFFHSRLSSAIENFKKSRDFDGDIILIEPRADDKAFFVLNPLSLRNRIEAAKLGFESVRNSIEEKFEEISEVLVPYGIHVSREGVEKAYEKISGASEEDIQHLLEGRKSAKKKALKGRARLRRVVRRISKRRPRKK